MRQRWVRLLRVGIAMALFSLILPQEAVDHIMEQAKNVPGYQVTVDLERGLVTDTQEFTASFEIDPFRRDCLLRGLDDIGLTMEHDDGIAAYEREHIVS